ncbi:MAG TPA: hypothetical protein VFH77_16915 [Streptomyces sp.]|nr:hypothetical protein [Streptomyces sp.]
MSTVTVALPCAGHPGLYDAVLFPDDGQTPDPAARAEAARLCAGCPTPCGEKVTADTGPAEVALLDEDWLPPATEGHAEPAAPAPKRRERRYVPPTGRDYVPTHRRLTAWQRMATEMAQAGRPLDEIALQLAVSADTAQRLIDATVDHPGRPPVDRGHGHRLTYSKGCRCQQCREANTAQCAEMRSRRVADPARADRAGHGKPSTYQNHGCRCEPCTAANTEKGRRQRAARRAKAVTS